MMCVRLAAVLFVWWMMLNAMNLQLLCVHRYNIICSGTAFIAVEERNDACALQGPMQTRRIPAAYCASFQMDSQPSYSHTSGCFMVSAYEYEYEYEDESLEDAEDCEEMGFR